MDTHTHTHIHTHKQSQTDVLRSSFWSSGFPSKLHMFPLGSTVFLSHVWMHGLSRTRLKKPLFDVDKTHTDRTDPNGDSAPQCSHWSPLPISPSLLFFYSVIQILWRANVHIFIFIKKLFHNWMKLNSHPTVWPQKPSSTQSPTLCVLIRVHCEQQETIKLISP